MRVDRVAESGIHELQRRDVHRHEEVRPLHRLAAGLQHDEIADFLDHPEFLGNPDEDVGRARFAERLFGQRSSASTPTMPRLRASTIG